VTETSLSIEIIKTKDLASYVRRPGILTGSVVPICPLRAAAHAANPAASPDDPALIAAMRDDECVGYLGLMPGQLRVDGQIRKIFWYSTWYSAQGPEGKGVGGVLVHASLRLGLDLATTGLDPKTFDFFRGLRFKSLEPLRYLVLDFDRLDPLGLPWRVLQVLLRRRGIRSSAVTGVFRSFRGVAKWIAYALAAPGLSRVASGYVLKEIPELPADATSGDPFPPVTFHRSAETVRWMLRYPWITDDVKQSTPRYEFSDYRELARFVVLEVGRSASGERLGYLVLSVCRDREGITIVRALDHFLQCDDRYRIVLVAVQRYALVYRADRVQVPEGCLPHLTELRWMPLVFRMQQREYFCYPARSRSVLGPELSRMSVQFCDGDTPFT
jgi:hypothetical protein